jgi:hypothetical protein
VIWPFAGLERWLRDHLEACLLGDVDASLHVWRHKVCGDLYGETW